MEPSLQAVENIRASSRNLVRNLGLLKSKHDQLSFSFTEGHVLIELEKYGEITPLELAQKLCLDKSTVSNTITQMLKKDLLQAEVSAVDRRQRRISLTEKGRHCVRQCHKVNNASVASALRHLTPEQLKTVQEGLELYANCLSQNRTASEVCIRPIQKEDETAMVAIIRKSLQEHGIEGPGSAMTDSDLLDLTGTYAQPQHGYSVALYKGNVVGGCGFGVLEGGDGHTAEIRKMYLSSESRGLGLGRLLLENALEGARNAGFKRCYLETKKSMFRARRLYEKVGFKQLDRALGNTGHFQCDAQYVLTLV